MAEGAKTTASPPADDDGYDPYKERKVEAPVSNVGTLLHFLKGSVGTGILGMPKGFYYTGLIFGTFATFLTGALCSYGLNLLMETEYLLCKRKEVPYLSYAEAMTYALQIGPTWMRPIAKASGITVNVFLVLYQLGTCCVYIIFVSSCVKTVIDNFDCNVISLRWLMTIFLILFLAINYVPNLKLFVPLSAVANLLILFALLCVFYYVFQDFPSLADRSYAGQPQHWVMFVGICMFAIESVAVVCSAEYSMAKPQSFGGFLGILNISYMSVTAVYWFMGFFGYGKFGNDIGGVITMNLPIEDKLAMVIQIFIALALIISYGLQCFPAIEIIWMGYISKYMKVVSKKKQVIYQYILRTVLVILTYLFAMVFAEHISSVISIIGVVCISILGFSFPGLMHLCLVHPNGYGKFKWVLVKDITMGVLGVLLMLIGLFTNIADMFVKRKIDNCSSHSTNITTGLFY